MAFADPQLIIGHRGAAGISPENTLPGFIKAQECGVQAVELDVHRCGDRLCVIHDETLERTTSGAGPIANWDPSELRQLDAGEGASIPFLEEVFDCLNRDIGINVELKGTGTAQPLAKLLHHYPDRDVLVSSFDHQALFDFQRLATDVPVAPLFQRWSKDSCKIAKELNAEFVNLARRAVNENRMREIGNNGLRCLVYTVNEPAQGRELLKYGVSGIFTDYPDRITLAALTGPGLSAADTSHR